MAKSNNIYSLGIDLSEFYKELERLRTEFNKGLDLNVEIPDDVVKQLKDIEDTLSIVQNRMNALGRSKVNSTTYNAFASEIKKSFADLDERTTALETAMARLVKTMSDADSSAFKRWVSDLRSGMSDLQGFADTTDALMKGIFRNSGKRAEVQIIDTNNLKDQQKELTKLLNIIREVQEGEREPKLKTFGSMAEAEEEINNALADAKKLKNELEQLSPDDTAYDSILKKLTRVVAKVDDLNMSAGANLNATVSNSIDEFMHSMDSVVGQIEKRIANINGRIESTLTGTITEPQKVGDKFSVPITISTSAKTLANQAAEIVNVASNMMGGHPIEVEFTLVSKRKRSQLNEALQKFQSQIDNVKDPAAQAQLQDIADSISGGFGKEIIVGLKNSLHNTKTEINQFIEDVRKALKEEPIVVHPKIEFTEEEMGAFRQQVLDIAQELNKVLYKAARQGFIIEDGDKTVDQFDILSKRAKKLVSDITNLPKTVAKATKQLPTDTTENVVAELDKQVEQIKEHALKLNDVKFGSEGAETLSLALKEAVTSLSTLLSLADTNNPLSKLFSEWNISDNIVSSFKDAKSMLERSAVLGSDKKIYGSYVYDEPLRTRGVDPTIKTLPDGVRPYATIHSHAYKRVATPSFANLKKTGEINGDLFAWANDFKENQTKYMLTFARNQIAAFDAESFYKGLENKTIASSKTPIVFDGKGSDKIKQIMRANYEGMIAYLETLPNRYLLDMSEELGNVSKTSFADKIENELRPYLGESFAFNTDAFTLAFSEITNNSDASLTDAIYTSLQFAIQNFATSIQQSVRKEIYNRFSNVDYVLSLLGLDTFSDGDIADYKIQKASPGLFDGSYLQYHSNKEYHNNPDYNLGIRELYENAIKQYTFSDFINSNPLNLDKDGLNGLFQNTGIESFATSLQSIGTSLQPLVTALEQLNSLSQSGTLTLGIDDTSSIATNIQSITNSLTELLDIIRQLSSVESGESLFNLNIDSEQINKMASNLTTLKNSLNSFRKEFKDSDFQSVIDPLVSIGTTLTELSDVIQRSTGILSSSRLDEEFEKIQKSAEGLGNIDLRKKAGKEAVQDLVDQYRSYLSAGGEKGIEDIGASKKLTKALMTNYEAGISGAKAETDEMDNLRVTAESTAEAKQMFAEANHTLFDSVIQSLGGIEDEGKALTALNKLINNVNGKNGAEKLENVKSAINEIREALNQPVSANSFMSALQELSSSGGNLSDLATVLKASRSEVSNANKELRNQNIEKRRAASQALLDGSYLDIQRNANAAIDALHLGTRQTFDASVDAQGYIVVSSYLEDIDGKIKAIQMRSEDGLVFNTASIEEGTKQALKYQQLLERMRTAQQNADNQTDVFVYDKNVDPSLWKEIIGYAEEYLGDIGEILSVTRQVRQEYVGGPLLESWSFNTKDKHITLGPQGNTVASNQNVLNVEEIASGWEKLTKTSAEYYKLQAKHLQSPDSMTGAEINRLQELSDEYERLHAALQTINHDLGDNNVANTAYMRYLSSISGGYDKYLNDSVTKARQKIDTKSQTLTNQGTTFTASFQEELNAARANMEEIEALRAKYRNQPMELWDDADLQRSYDLIQKIDGVVSRLGDNTNISAKVSDVNKMISRLSKELEDNGAMSGSLRQRYQDLIDRLVAIRASASDANGELSATNKIELGKIKSEYQELNAELQLAGKTGKSFMQQISGQMSTQAAAFIARFFSFQDLIRYGREITQTVTAVDTSMKELQKVSSGTDAQMTQSFKASAETAKTLGATITDVIDSTADWSRLGYSLPDAQELARVTTMYQNIANGIDQSSASEYLVSTLQGYQMQASEAESIIDSINKVANNFAIDQAGIGEALERSAASFYAAHTDLNKSIALVTTGNAVLQNPESVGTAFKTLSARLRGASAE